MLRERLVGEVRQSIGGRCEGLGPATVRLELGENPLCQRLLLAFGQLGRFGKCLFKCACHMLHLCACLFELCVLCGEYFPPHPAVCTLSRQAKLRLTIESRAPFSGKRRSSRSMVRTTPTATTGFSCALSAAT